MPSLVKPKGTGRKRDEPFFSPQEIFDSHTVVLPDGCWIWDGALTRGEYGAMVYEGRMTPAHRVSWILHNGSIPDDLWVLHHCDVRSCVNPAHLFLGTRQDNMDDMKAKHRQSFVPSRGHRTLEIEDVREIRRLLAMGEKQERIGKLFNVTQSAVSGIKTGRAWRGEF